MTTKTRRKTDRTRKTRKTGNTKKVRRTRKTGKGTRGRKRKTLRGIRNGGAKNVTKKDLVRDISIETGLSQAKVQDVVESMTDCIKSAVKGGKNVTLSRFGTFKGKRTAKRSIKSIATGKRITVGGNQVMKFNASKA